MEPIFEHAEPHQKPVAHSPFEPSESKNHKVKSRKQVRPKAKRQTMNGARKKESFTERQERELLIYWTRMRKSKGILDRL